MEILKMATVLYANAAIGNFTVAVTYQTEATRRQASGKRTVDYIDASLKHITLIVKQDKVERRPCRLCPISEEDNKLAHVRGCSKCNLVRLRSFKFSARRHSRYTGFGDSGKFASCTAAESRDLPGSSSADCNISYLKVGVGSCLELRTTVNSALQQGHLAVT